MKYKIVNCPCCQKNVNIELKTYKTGYEYPKEKGFSELDAKSLINDREDFFDIIDLCPECGYPMLFDIKMKDIIRRIINNDSYKKRLNSNMDKHLKKWMLLAFLLQAVEEYSEAGVAFIKTYDYLELNKLKIDKTLMKEASICFTKAAEKDESFTDALLSSDCMRRFGNMKEAERLLNKTKEMFVEESKEKTGKHAINMEWAWININVDKKRDLDIVEYDIIPLSRNIPETRLPSFN